MIFPNPLTCSALQAEKQRGTLRSAELHCLSLSSQHHVQVLEEVISQR